MYINTLKPTPLSRIALRFSHPCFSFISHHYQLHSGDFIGIMVPSIAYYQQKFIVHKEENKKHHQDAWTVDFFSRMMCKCRVGPRLGGLCLFSVTSRSLRNR